VRDRQVSIPPEYLQGAVHRALQEDAGRGDVTTEAIVPANAQGAAVIIAKAAGIICGLSPCEACFRTLDPDLVFTVKTEDGRAVEPGAIVADIEGRLRPILTAERAALNFLQRLSGIATLTARFVERVQGTKAVILDTRKTTPGLRLFEKYAVRCGGGHNHRFGLDDGILIKDNHTDAAGGVGEAVRRMRAAQGKRPLPIEVEVEALDQIEVALAAGAAMLLLDNFSVDDLRRAVDLVEGRAELEASGGVTLESVRAVAETGVDYISVGRLTHSAPALDLSLEVTRVTSPDSAPAA